MRQEMAAAGFTEALNFALVRKTQYKQCFWQDGGNIGWQTFFFFKVFSRRYFRQAWKEDCRHQSSAYFQPQDC